MALDLFELAAPSALEPVVLAAPREHTFSVAFASWWLATLLGAAADVATTGVALSVGLPERNPLYPLLLALFGPATLLAMGLLKLPLLGLLLYLRAAARRFGLWAAVVACLVQLAYAITNLVILLLALHILRLSPAM